MILSLLRWMEEELRQHGLHDRADLVHQALLDPLLRPHVRQSPMPRLPQRKEMRRNRTAQRMVAPIDNQPFTAIPLSSSLL